MASFTSWMNSDDGVRRVPRVLGAVNEAAAIGVHVERAAGGCPSTPPLRLAPPPQLSSSSIPNPGRNLWKREIPHERRAERTPGGKQTLNMAWSMEPGSLVRVARVVWKTWPPTSTFTCGGKRRGSGHCGVTRPGLSG